jgi:hypothetical protein
MDTDSAQPAPGSNLSDRDSPPVGWAQLRDLPPGIQLSWRQVFLLVGVACIVAGYMGNVVRLMLGSQSPPPSPSTYAAQGAFMANLGSQEFLVTLLTSAEKTAEAEHAQTFAGVTTTELGSALPGISAMTGAVSEPSEVSVDICADGAPCKTIELASSGDHRHVLVCPGDHGGIRWLLHDLWQINAEHSLHSGVTRQRRGPRIRLACQLSHRVKIGV